MEKNKSIKLMYDEKLICEIDNSNPSFKALVTFVNSQENIRVELFSVDQIDKFDSDSFLTIIRQSVTDYNKQKALNNEAYIRLREKLDDIDK